MEHMGQESIGTVQAVVADLDGTVVRPDGQISDATLAALDSLRAAGIPLVLATARTPPGVEHLSQLASRAALAVCCSGAIGWSPAEQSTLWSERLEPVVVRQVVGLAVDAGAGVAGFDGELWRMTARYNALSPGAPRGPVRVPVDAGELAEIACVTMAVRHADGGLDKLEALLQAESVPCAQSHAGGSVILDVTPVGVDKGTGVCQALGHLGVPPAAAVGFGDMPNDIPLFRAVGRSYAVGSAHDAVVGAADEVLPDVLADGFATKLGELKAAGWALPSA